MQDQIVELLRAALKQVAAGPFPTLEVPERIGIERTRDASHGDFATNVAMASARSARANPRQIAEAIVAALPNDPQVDKVEIAGPGFINFFLTRDAATAVVGRVLDAGADYGRAAAPSGRKVMVEFVSANPNGPLHVGHGRGAALGDCIANLLAAAGHTVAREYYVNDAGRQMDILAASIWVRYLEQLDQPMPFPTGGYQGAYVRDIASGLVTTHGDRFLHPAAEVQADLGHDAPAGDKDAYADALIAKMKALLGDDFALVHAAGLNSQLSDIRDDLEGFGIVYDRWFSEASLVTDGAVEHALEQLRASGHTVERDGALWLKSSEMGDEKDRVLVRANGAYTYFATDIAYHLNKLERGFDTLVNVWGADHQAYNARMPDSIEELTSSDEALLLRLSQFVSMFRAA
ncbi:MAG: arginine--tRNA ligase [Abyssibacter sp.]|uniref:arginine--tRNA ligase n=1 Tax=Abyssibacter sp. TaxID=2320200 RepID=UPI00321B6B06